MGNFTAEDTPRPLGGGVVKPETQSVGGIKIQDLLGHTWRDHTAKLPL